MIADSNDLPNAFRAAMRRMTTTVSIITSLSDGARYGMAATAVCSLTANPPAILACVNQTASIHDPIGTTRRYCINILSCAHADLVPIFSGTRTGEDRFTAGEWGESPEGVPYLCDAEANIFCTVAQSVNYETHTIFIGKVEAILLGGEVAPLLYQEGSLFRSVGLAL